MEDLATALSINQVPGRNPFHKCSWEKYAWPSKRPLSSWFQDLLRRVDQFTKWSSTLETPLSIWLPGIFNPMAVLTAIMQVTARSTGLPLDKMAVDTYVTTMMQPSEATAYPENGMYAHGLFMEGARWATGEEAGDAVMVGHTPTAGFITESRLKQLLPPMPLLCAFFWGGGGVQFAVVALAQAPNARGARRAHGFSHHHPPPTHTHTRTHTRPHCRPPRRARAVHVDPVLRGLPAAEP